jgi:hypothetical protein
MKRNGYQKEPTMRVMIMKKTTTESGMGIIFALDMSSLKFLDLAHLDRSQRQETTKLELKKHLKRNNLWL